MSVTAASVAERNKYRMCKPIKMVLQVEKSYKVGEISYVNKSHESVFVVL